MSNPENKKNIVEINLPVLRQRTENALKGVGDLAFSTLKLPKAFVPLAQLLISEEDVQRETLAHELDLLFVALYQHPISEHSRSLTQALRRYKIIPNEDTTEGLMRFLVRQVIARSPVEVPDVVVDEFWTFFHELISAPELKGLVELNLDIVRSVLRTYEPLLLDLVNRVKHLRRSNQSALGDMVYKARVLRSDAIILKRQIRAIRYIKPFLQTDPRDFSAQAQIVAQMVREFGPLFIKMAQVAAANSDFLPEEIAKELKIFQQDVSPMTEEEVFQAFYDSMGKSPHDIYFGFDATRPLRSGSIGSVFVAKKPVVRDGMEVLVPVIVKVARHNLEREFQMGALALELMLISSQYWAPHSKILPFLESMSKQVKEFTKGFEQELNFQSEADVQKRFADLSRDSEYWSVPELYSVKGRIIEMEYLQNALSVSQLVKELTALDREKVQRKVADAFLYTVLQHIFVYQEFHGDLHPGNILVSPEGMLYLIDWGNTVDMKNKWALVRQYLIGALAADVDKLADSLIGMSTHPEENQAKRDGIREALRQTLEKKQVRPLEENSVRILIEEGVPGLHRRLQSIMHLMSNTYQLGIIIQSDYLHLSRSLTAMAGSYMALYDGVPRTRLATDLLSGVAMFPLRLVKDRIKVEWRELQKRLTTTPS
ncbi:MAG: AarF/ABC1/UbiB kinase family protein [Hahellaceae bacterium]|jgi:ubiquinone biosynthesis protein|nr:AarF/ABC1/UbiB kinase family protein [Hahellaceae bacterium]